MQDNADYFVHEVASLEWILPMGSGSISDKYAVDIVFPILRIDFWKSAVRRAS